MQIDGIAPCAVITFSHINFLDWYSCAEERIVFGVWERMGMMEAQKTVTQEKEGKKLPSFLSPISTEETSKEEIKLKKIKLTSWTHGY